MPFHRSSTVYVRTHCMPCSLFAIFSLYFFFFKKKNLWKNQNPLRKRRKVDVLKFLAKSVVRYFLGFSEKIFEVEIHE